MSSGNIRPNNAPGARSASPIRRWSAMNIDIDGAPLIGALSEHLGVSFAANVIGYKLGPLMEREAAGIALHGRTRTDLAPLSIQRFDNPKEGTTL